MANFADRVRILATNARFNATSLGKELGIASSTAANYWSGKRPWPTETLPDLARTLGVNLDFLLTGEGLEITANGVTRAVLGDRRLTYQAPERERDRDDLVEVAEIDPRFGAGGVIMDEHAVPEMRTFSRTWLRQITSTPPEELYWGRPRGNSMAPTIDDGEPILIDRRQNTVLDADLIWAFAWGDIGAIKRLRPLPNGTVQILSDNPSVPIATAVEGEIHIFGRVIAVVKNV